MDFVTVGLAGLCQQDQRRGIGGLEGKGEIQQDERIDVELGPAGQIDADPDRDDEGLPDQEHGRPEKARESLGLQGEPVVAEHGTEMGVRKMKPPVMAAGRGLRYRPTLNSVHDGLAIVPQTLHDFMTFVGELRRRPSRLLRHPSRRLRQMTTGAATHKMAKGRKQSRRHFAWPPPIKPRPSSTALPRPPRSDVTSASKPPCKGAPLAKLVGKTYDGFDIQPLYARTAGKPRAFRAEGDWAVIARVDHTDAVPPTS